MTIIRLATTGEMREWLEQLQKEDEMEYLHLVKIITRNPPTRFHGLPK
jgi:hypothetical protein